MKHRYLSVVTILAALVLLVGFASPRDTRTQDLEERIQALEAQVQELKAGRETVEQNLKAHQDILAQVFGWFRQLDGACNALNGSMDSARRNGFEKAGPNPRAKTNVLDGLKIFAQTLKAGNPAPKVRPTVDKPARGRNNRSGRRERDGRRDG